MELSHPIPYEVPAVEPGQVLDQNLNEMPVDKPKEMLGEKQKIVPPRSIELYENERLEKRRKCMICGRMLSNETKLKVHLRTHTGVRPFKCNVCDKLYCDENSLKRHVSKKHKALTIVQPIPPAMPKAERPAVSYVEPVEIAPVEIAPVEIAPVEIAPVEIAPESSDGSTVIMLPENELVVWKTLKNQQQVISVPTCMKPVVVMPASKTANDVDEVCATSMAVVQDTSLQAPTSLYATTTDRGEHSLDDKCPPDDGPTVVAKTAAEFLESWHPDYNDDEMVGDEVDEQAVVIESDLENLITVESDNPEQETAVKTAMNGHVELPQLIEWTCEYVESPWELDKCLEQLYHVEQLAPSDAEEPMPTQQCALGPSLLPPPQVNELVITEQCAMNSLPPPLLSPNVNQTALMQLSALDLLPPLSPGADDPMPTQRCALDPSTAPARPVAVTKSADNTKRYRCNVCGRRLKYYASLRDHMVAEHAYPSLVAPPSRMYSCGWCSAKIRGRSAYRGHVKTFHPRGPTRGPQNIETMFQCPLCQGAVSSKHSLFRHLQLKHGFLKNPCHLCSIPSAYADTFKEYCETHSRNCSKLRDPLPIPGPWTVAALSTRTLRSAAATKKPRRVTPAA